MRTRKQRVYIETTIVSYLVADPSPILLVAARQQTTHQWWQRRRGEFACFISEFVLREAEKGDPTQARARLTALGSIAMLPVEDEAIALAEELITEGALPEKAATDALHLAMASVHEMDVLLTWNCRHLANATILGGIGRMVRSKGYELPIVCTPDELMGELADEGV